MNEDAISKDVSDEEAARQQAAARSAEEQRALWNGSAGRAWVERQALLDRMFLPFEELLAAAAGGAGGGAVLDVGCGTGGTTLAAARRLLARGQAGGEVRCVGVDLSAPMLELARARAASAQLPASFVQGDAEAHAFEAASFDAIISRFGVMFFADPVRAFRNLRGATRPGAALCCIAWRSAAENPFMTTAERAVAPLLPELPARRPDGPGQFAFGDAARVRGILEASGWREIEVRPLDVACALPERELEPYLARLGPLGMILPTLDEALRARVLETARAAFAPFVQGDEVRFTAACWQLGARS